MWLAKSSRLTSDKPERLVLCSVEPTVSPSIESVIAQDGPSSAVGGKQKSELQVEEKISVEGLALTHQHNSTARELSSDDAMHHSTIVESKR